MSFNGKRPVAVVIGPTAVGKTETAVIVAEQINSEIISADSRQIYRKMDIGTAKPTSEQRARVPHHLVDIIDPDEAFNVTDFQERTYALIDDMHQRGVLPMLVGGTGQYITATVEGWHFPNVAPDHDLRAELEIFAEEHGWEALVERLRQHDPLSAARIDGRNIRRVVRALEVSMLSGRPFSDFQRKTPPPYEVITFGLTLDPRERLYERADHRIEQMLAAGLVDEVENLADEGYDWGLSAMHALGYLQIGWYLQGEMSLNAAIHELKRATHLFIRRQYTWFRKHNPDTYWMQSEASAASQILDQLQNWMQDL